MVENFMPYILCQLKICIVHYVVGTLFPDRIVSDHVVWVGGLLEEARVTKS